MSNRKTKSMRGEVVDFDLFDIKAQINEAPVTETIQSRERFINLKRKRGTRRKLQDMLAEQEVNQQSVTDSLAASAEETPAATKRKIIKRDDT